MMHNSLMNQLQLCTATSSTQNIFAQAPVSFKLFCPNLCKILESLTCPLIKRPNKDTPQIEQQDAKRHKGESKGAIINTSRRKIFFPRGLEKKQCADFLDSASVCSHGSSCKLVRALYPKGFTTNDLPIINKHIGDTPGLSLNPSIKFQRVS